MSDPATGRQSRQDPRGFKGTVQENAIQFAIDSVMMAAKLGHHTSRGINSTCRMN
jgi:hypothetical protein